MSSSFIRAALSAAAIGAVLAASGAAHAAAQPDPTFEQLRRMEPDQARAWVKRQVERQAARRGAATLGAGDTSAPVLTKFDSPLSTDAAGPLAPVAIKATDDKSGLRSAGGYAIGPSGQTLWVNFYSSFPEKKSAGFMHAYEERAYLEAGTYVFSWIYVVDVAGNHAFYDQTQLAALGNTAMVLKNKNGYDPLPPTLKSGLVLTPSLSLNAKQPGTDAPAYIGVSAQFNDTGASAVAGLQYASATYCLLDSSSCVYLYDDGAGRPGKAAVALKLGGQIDPVSNLPGEYHLQTLYASDFAGNYVNMTSVEFGGDVDFSAYFPTTTFTITP